MERRSRWPTEAIRPSREARSRRCWSGSGDGSAAEHPRSRQVQEAGSDLLSGVPMNWMTRWPGQFPVFFVEAEGARVVDVDGNEYVDLCLGDTGAMTGHSPPPTVKAASEQPAHGITTMLPSPDAAEVGTELARRFGLRPLAVEPLRDRREPVRRQALPAGHGATEDPRPQPLLPRQRRRDRGRRRDGKVVPRHGNIGPPVDPELTTRVVEFNDLEALERELEQGDVACVLVEPALTNIGIVLPERGLPRRAAGALHRDRDAAGDRRDPHVQLRPRRLRPPTGWSRT